jgi:hypothetical protein
LIKSESSLKEPISSSSETDKIKSPQTSKIPHASLLRNWSVLTFLSLSVILMAIFVGQFVNALIQVTSPIAQVLEVDPPLLVRGGSPLKPFDLPAHRTMLYAQKDNIYSVTTGNSAKETDQTKKSVVLQPLQIETPGYKYNPSLPPLVTPARQLIYVGTGLWMTDLMRNQAHQIAALSDNQEVTSLVLSRDGTQLAWSTAPKDGQGEIQIFAGPIGSTKLVYQQVAAHCPCFRVFSFWSASGVAGHDTLLLTDDHGDDGPVQHGLWTFPMNKGPLVKPALVIKSDPPQGPLVLSPDNTNLLYTTYKGNVPAPRDMPDELATVEYANSLVVASLQSTTPYLKNTHVVLPEQHVQQNNAQYHWVMSPNFSPDGQRLVYVEFSADSQGAFTRTNALYMAQMQGDTAPTRPTLIATTAAHYIELGSWWDAHTVTVFIDKGFYALDIQRGMLATITQTDGYAHEIAVLN